MPLSAPEQSLGGEDFSWYLAHTNGAMARLGVWSGQGQMHDIHQPTFDLDERALAARSVAPASPPANAAPARPRRNLTET